MVCPLAKIGWLGPRVILPGPQALQPGTAPGHRRLQNGASNNNRWGEDVVGGEMLQQRPGGTAP